MAIERTRLPTGWRWEELGKLAAINPRRPAIVRSDLMLTTFVPMPAVSEKGRGITGPELKPYGEIKKGYTYFEEGDVLFAKITPCMQNGKHAVARDLTNGIGFGSTEFHVVRPYGQLIGQSGDPVLAEWIHLYFLHPSVVAAATQAFKGAVGQQRVPPELLHRLPIPVPPVTEQRRIIDFLREQLSSVERARERIRLQIGQSALLSDAFIQNSLSQPAVANSPRMPLGEVCSIHARQVDPMLPQYARMPHVSSENIVGARCRITNVRTAAEDAVKSGKYLFKSGNVLYSKIRPLLRKVAEAEFDGVCSADIYPLVLDESKLIPAFATWVLAGEEFTRYAVEESRRARIPKLNRNQLFVWKIPLPAPAVQHAVAAELAQQMVHLEALRGTLEEQLTDVSALSSTLLRDAFTPVSANADGTVTVRRSLTLAT